MSCCHVFIVNPLIVCPPLSPLNVNPTKTSYLKQLFLSNFPFFSTEATSNGDLKPTKISTREKICVEANIEHTACAAAVMLRTGTCAPCRVSWQGRGNMIQIPAVLIKQHLSLSPPNVHGKGIPEALPYREMYTHGRGGRLEIYIVSRFSCRNSKEFGPPIAKILILNTA